MTEYLVVVIALVTGLIMVPESYCGGDDDDQSCVSYLLEVIQDNYQGYSTSITEVQIYYDDVVGHAGDYSDDDDDDDDDPDSGSGGDLDLGDGLTETTYAYGYGCNVQTGIVQPDNTVVNADGELLGTYDPVTEEITYTTGCVEDNPQFTSVVIDCEGNPMDLLAVKSKITGKVVGFGYETDAEDCAGFYLTSDKAEPYDLNPILYELVDTEGLVDPTYQAESGAIVDGLYYANTVIFTLQNQDSFGEVVLFDRSALDCDDNPLTFTACADQCAVMANVSGNEWDKDASNDNERYAVLVNSQLGLSDAQLGWKDPVDFAKNGCDPNQTVVATP